MSKNIEMLIESRIELGKTYLSQRKAVMPVNEEFNSTILTNLMNLSYNRPAFRAIKSKIDVVWTDITNSMIRVYNTGSDYSHVKKLIVGEKSLLKNTERYGIYIFTDKDDVIHYVLAGSKAADDTVYVSSEMQDLLEERWDLLNESRRSIKGKFGINLDNLPLGTSLDVDAGNEANVNVAEVLLKCLYDFLSSANTQKPRHDGTVLRLSDPIGKNSVFDENTFATYKDAYDLLAKTARHNYIKGICKFIGNSTDWDLLRKSFRLHPDKYDVFSYINKDLLADFLVLATVAPNAGDEGIDDDPITPTMIRRAVGDDVELKDYYDRLLARKLRNSLVFNLGLRVGETKNALPRDREITQYSQLLLVPDLLSHLYLIHQEIKDDTQLANIKDFDDEKFKVGTPHERISRFKSEDAERERRENFDVGNRERPSGRFSSYYDPDAKNPGGNQGRATNSIQAARRALRQGLVATSREINQAKSQLARDTAWDEEQSALGNKDFWKRQREKSDKRTVGLVTTHDQDLPSNVKFSRIPELKLRKIFQTFKDTYSLITENSITEYESLLKAYETYYLSRESAARASANSQGTPFDPRTINVVESLKPLSNFFIYTSALATYMDDLVAYNTFGDIKEDTFVKTTNTLYNDYLSYIDIAFELFDAYGAEDDNAIYSNLSKLGFITKRMKSTLGDFAKSDEEVEQYVAEARDSIFKPSKYIDKRVKK